MDKSSKPISASEINRFCYCPWQWYYERLHGAAEIRRLAKERNAALGYSDSGRSAFNKGRDFHEHYMARYSVRVALRRLVVAVVAAAVLMAGAWLWLRYA